MYFLKRLFLIVPTFFCIICVNFFIIHYAPGNPVSEILNQEDPSLSQKQRFKTHIIDQDTIKQLTTDFELDKPVYQQFFSMMKRYGQFDLGYSYFKGQSVNTLIKKSLPISLSLGLISTFFVFLLSIPLGVLKAQQNKRLFDWVSTLFLGTLYATPPFAIAVVLILFLGNYFPMSDFSSQQKTWLHLILPVISLVLWNLAKPTILMKNSLLEELNKPYIITIRAKGASESYILWKHCFKNATLVTLSSFTYVFLFTFYFGTVVIEFLFSLNGLGYLGFEATANRDYPVILGCLYIYAFFGICCHIISDFMYSALDKRIRLGKKAV